MRWLLLVMSSVLAELKLFVPAASFLSDSLIRPTRTRISGEESFSVGMALFNTEDLEKLLFGQLLADSKSDKDDPQQELASFPELVHGPISNVSVAHDSLTSYLYLWSIQQLEQSSTETTGSQHRPLTTPVTTSDFVHNRSLECDNADEEDDSLVSNERSSRMKIMFRPPKRYLSYKEQKGLDKGIIPDRKGAKLDAWSPGGVEVMVETTRHCQENNTYQLSLSARRCGVDGDTVIKFSSERAIVRRLDEAVRIWKKVREFRTKS